MRVMHTYCLNYNFGDYALGQGVKNIFRQCYDISYFAECNIQGQIFDDYFINILNKKYDVLVIGGGGIIHGAHWPNGWFWLIEQNKIKNIQIPFIVYGAGYNYFETEEGIPKKGIKHLQETSKRAAFFSVRNDGSYERLRKQTGLDAEVIADPGFWYSLDEIPVFKEINQPYVIVQLADDKPEHRFINLEKRREFIKNLASVLSLLSDKAHILFLPHVWEDISISKEIAKLVKNSSVFDFSSYAFDRYELAMNLYKGAQFVLAMRGHGQIIPLSFGTPVISLENHPKHRGLMELYGLGEFNVNIMSKLFSDELNHKISGLLNQIGIIQAYIKTQNGKLYMDTKTKLLSISQLKQYAKAEISNNILTHD
jgi:polysaccharide pyruvyl transferase WcaK-like protein